MFNSIQKGQPWVNLVIWWVIYTLENNWSDEHFSKLSNEIKIFWLENDIAIDNSLQGNINLPSNKIFIIILLFYHTLTDVYPSSFYIKGFKKLIS